MEQQIKFSVVICVYIRDDARQFEQALNSIFRQTCPPDEVVIVIDGKITDEIEQVIQKFCEKYSREDTIKLVRFEENKGHGYARREGVRQSSYDLVAMMDADDISRSRRFEKQLECFRNNSRLSIVGSNIAEFVGTTNNVVAKRCVPQSHEAIVTYMKKRCPFNQMTVMRRKDVVERAGNYQDWYCDEDYYLWIRMYLAGAVFGNIDECLVYARVGEEMYQRRGGYQYFVSEAKLQRYMYQKKMISFGRCFYNICIRFAVQVLMPNRIRQFVFLKFARDGVKK